MFLRRIWLIALCCSGQVWAQEYQIYEEIKKPVVLIDAGKDNDVNRSIGAGILLGNEAGEIFILTARHVVKDNPDDIAVTFYRGRRKINRVDIILNIPDVDLAVLKCSIPNGMVLEQSYGTTLGPIQLRQPITMIGHPLGITWHINHTQQVSGLEDDKFDKRYFATSYSGVKYGMSGGPVLDMQNRLMGMVQRINALEQAICLRADYMNSILKGKGIPMNLLWESRFSIDPRSYTDPFLQTEMVYIPAGRFQMGSNSKADEGPVRRIDFPAFYIGRHEVTQAQWYKVMGTRPSYFPSCDECPVEQVSWNEVQEFLRRLNVQSSYTYRLPSEAEWEYVARVGEKSSNSARIPLDSKGWYGLNSQSHTWPVGRKQPNDFGLYDLCGNVWEWCQDYYHSSYNGAPSDGSARRDPSAFGTRVARGGSWNLPGRYLSGSYRFGLAPNEKKKTIGFRLARTF